MTMRTLPVKFTSLSFLVILCLAPLRAQNPTSPPAGANPAAVAQGRQIFATYCSGCHGLDASGTQRAPNLGASSRIDRLPADEVRKIISGGIPDRGMPAFRALGEDKLTAILAYLDQLRGKNTGAALAGNPQRGEQLFFGGADCSSCHSLAGKGGFIAPDLTAYGQSHSPAQTKAAITDAGARDSVLPVATVSANDGTKFRGVIRNEDNFSLQLQALDGSFHFFRRAAIKSIDRESGSLMPSDYAQRLSAEQLDDLVAFLNSVKSARASDKEKDED